MPQAMEGVPWAMTPKETVRQLLEALPDDCTFEDIQYRIYVRQKVTEGEVDLANGREVSAEEFERRLEQWLSK